MGERKPLSSRVRFEVFKRDLFTCQYCGQKAPDVILHCDHVIPVSKGGTNDFVNLATSCESCNRGKGAKLLSDDAAIVRQRQTLEELQERQNQIEMMIEWRKSLDQAEQQPVEAFNEWLGEKTGYAANENGKATIKKLLKRFSLEELLEGAAVSFDQYAEWVGNTITDKSWEKAFSKIGGVCTVRRASKEKPYLSKVLYIQGIIRRRFQAKWFSCSALIEECHLAGASLESIEDLAKGIDDLDAFCDELRDYIEGSESGSGGKDPDGAAS